jgi:outer membrane protein TolC
MRPSAAIGTACALSLLALVASGAAGAQESRAETVPEAAATMKLSLADATAFAVRNNLALKAALIEEQISQQRVSQALAAFDPTFRASANAGKVEQLFADVFPVPGSPTGQTVVIANPEDVADLSLGLSGKLCTGATYDLTLGQTYAYQQSGGAINPVYNTVNRLQFTQPLLRGAWASYQCAPIDIARNESQQSRQLTRTTTLAKIREVEVAYFELVAARENRAVRQRSLEVADQLLEINRVKVDTGALPPIEITSAESARAFRRSELVTAEAEVLTAADRVRREIFAFQSTEDWTVAIEPTENIEERAIELIPLDSLIEVAMRTEPRILRARLEVARRERELDMRRSERKPTLDAVGAVDFTSLDESGFQTYADLYDGANNALSFTAGLVFEYPLGNRFRSAREAEARLEVSRAAIVLRNLEIEVHSQVRNAVRNLDVAGRAIRARRDAVRLADQQVEVERAKFDVQASTNFQVFEIEDQRSQRRIELVRALIAHRLALLDLPRVTGAPLSELVVRMSETPPGD